jgi:lipoate-protein ligase B
MKQVKSLQCFVEKLEESVIKTLNNSRTQYNVLTAMQNYVCGNRLKRKIPKQVCMHNFLR